LVRQLPARTVEVGECATLVDVGDGHARMPLSARQRQRLHPSVQVRLYPCPALRRRGGRESREQPRCVHVSQPLLCCEKVNEGLLPCFRDLATLIAPSPCPRVHTTECIALRELLQAAYDSQYRPDDESNVTDDARVSPVVSPRSVLATHPIIDHPSTAQPLSKPTVPSLRDRFAAAGIGFMLEDRGGAGAATDRPSR
jgi:hypothetical protein